MAILESTKEIIGFAILTWNSEKVIDACLDSISGLSSVEPRIVLVDNGSTDNTVLIIEKFIQRTSIPVELIQFSKNMGTTIPRNVALHRLMDVRPDYYCILDSDTVVNDAAFLTMITELSKHQQYGIIGPEMRTTTGYIQMSARSFPTLLEKLCKGIPSKYLQAKGEQMELQLAPHPDAASYPVDYLMSACWLITPKTIEKAGGLDEKIFYAPEDAEYCIRVWKSGLQVAFCPEAKIIHEWQRLSKRKLISKMNWVHICGLVYMFRKHHYLFTTKKLKMTFILEETK